MDRDAAFDEWYRVHYDRLLRSIVILCGDLEEARDVADETVVRCLVRSRRRPQVEDLSAWAYRTAVRHMWRTSRRRSLERRVAERLDRAPVEDLSPPALELWREVARLPPRQRLAVVLRYIGGLSEAQTAAAMGVAPGTVGATLSSARAALTRQIPSTTEPSV